MKLIHLEIICFGSKQVFPSTDVQLEEITPPVTMNTEFALISSQFAFGGMS